MLEKGIYRHFKGRYYELLSVAQHSETMAFFVVYRALYGEWGTWVRPLEMFDERIEREGKTMKRFSRINDTEADLMRARGDVTPPSL